MLISCMQSKNKLTNTQIKLKTENWILCQNDSHDLILTMFFKHFFCFPFYKMKIMRF